MDKKTFILTEDHLKLLRHMHTRWDDSEFGAPAVDSKRPYGNTSVFKDMVDILRGKPIGKVRCMGQEFTIEVDDWEMPDELEKTLRALHEETETALQIVLYTGTFKAGLYQAGEYSDNWELVQ